MFRFKQFAVRQDRCPMKVGTDGVLLGAWAEVRPGDRRMLDVGTGTGLIALMLAQRSAARITAVDVDAECATQAAENFAASPWADRLDAVAVAVQRYDPVERFDLIVSIRLIRRFAASPMSATPPAMRRDCRSGSLRRPSFGCLRPADALLGVATRRDAAISFGGSRAALSRSLDGGLFYAPGAGCGVSLRSSARARTAAGTFAARDRTRRLGLLYGGLPPSDGGFLP